MIILMCTRWQTLLIDFGYLLLDQSLEWAYVWGYHLEELRIVVISSRVCFDAAQSRSSAQNFVVAWNACGTVSLSAHAFGRSSLSRTKE